MGGGGREEEAVPLLDSFWRAPFGYAAAAQLDFRKEPRHRSTSCTTRPLRFRFGEVVEDGWVSGVDEESSVRRVWVG